MNNDKDFNRACREGIISVAGLVLAMLACILIGILMQSCTATKYVPVESVRTEYVDRAVDRLVTDTVHDTRFVLVKGDTVVDIRTKERIRNVEIHDTCYIERSDTIKVPYPVERTLSKWEQTKIDFGGMAMGGAVALCVVVIALAVWLIKTKRSK